ncbi:hypothetical protein [Shimazuella alba]|uniref:Uncharacterized protein n=1 Tax=Shimazuella alba TaxID=2690964 RepID=A0A6I4VRX1_9BACL|nr:hypothetical protein [Shimazuella alba]MXQ53763.1 hypothetical protein [Shimazuella alba]
MAFVSTVTKETATISKVSYFGEKDGLTTIFLDAIEVISYDTTDEKAIKILYQHVND